MSEDEKHNLSDNEPRKSWDEVFIGMLEVLAKRSCCLKIKTAALIVKNGLVVSMGYNGTFSKAAECSSYWRNFFDVNILPLSTVQEPIDKKGASLPTIISPDNLVNALDTDEEFSRWLTTSEIRVAHREWSAANEMHAEANALRWLNMRDDVMHGGNSPYILYTLYSPCDVCAKGIISYGIKRVYYKYKYIRGDNAIARMRNYNIIVENINI